MLEPSLDGRSLKRGALLNGFQRGSMQAMSAFQQVPLVEAKIEDESDEEVGGVPDVAAAVGGVVLDPADAATKSLVEQVAAAAAQDPETVNALAQQWAQQLAQAQLVAAAAQGVSPMPQQDELSIGDVSFEGRTSGGGSHRMRRAAWTQEEEQRLTELASRYAATSQRMCWRVIAQELGTGRSSKQCREHYLNSLRPNMKKGNWTQEEEYVIAREHSKHGTHWCQIAKKLPGRTDNSIKNFYNATIRSKAINKLESFLWVYVDLHHRKGMAARDAFPEAERIWSANANPTTVQQVMKGVRPAGSDSTGSALGNGQMFDNSVLEMLNGVPGGMALFQQLATSGQFGHLGPLNPVAAAAAAAAAAAGQTPSQLISMLSGLGMPAADLAQALGRGPVEDGAEALMLLQQAGVKRERGESDPALEAAINSLLRGKNLQDMLSGAKRDRPDMDLANLLTSVVGGMSDSGPDAKRARGLDGNESSPTGDGNGQPDRARQELLAQLGLALPGGGAGMPALNLPGQANPGQAGNGQPDVLQQQLLLQQLLSAATQGPGGDGSSEGTSQSADGSADGGASGALAALLQQITGQGGLLAHGNNSQQTPLMALAQQGNGATSLLSLLGVTDANAGHDASNALHIQVPTEGGESMDGHASGQPTPGTGHAGDMSGQGLLEQMTAHLSSMVPGMKKEESTPVEEKKPIITPIMQPQSSHQQQAAPPAGLPFDPSILAQLSALGESLQGQLQG